MKEPAPFVCTLAYALVNIRTGAIAYGILAHTAKECWEQYREAWPSDPFKRKQGWRAKRVRVEELGP